MKNRRACFSQSCMNTFSFQAKSHYQYTLYMQASQTAWPTKALLTPILNLALHASIPNSLVNQSIAHTNLESCLNCSLLPYSSSFRREGLLLFFQMLNAMFRGHKAHITATYCLLVNFPCLSFLNYNFYHSNNNSVERDTKK